MRILVFIALLIIFVIFLWIEPLIAIPLIPSLLVSYWIYEDGEKIEELQARINSLEKTYA